MLRMPPWSPNDPPTDAGGGSETTKRPKWKLIGSSLPNLECKWG